jgi:hypothetical protein
VNPLLEELRPLQWVDTTIHQHVWYPPHGPRVESAAYKKVRHAMIVEEDGACFVCGVRKSTLSKKRHNRFGATQMELHHCVIEWAFMNAVELAKFNERIARPRHGRAFTRREMRAWIDHDRGNLQVLCDVHHRAPGRGVHALTGPVWEAKVFLQ